MTVFYLSQYNVTGGCLFGTTQKGRVSDRTLLSQRGHNRQAVFAEPDDYRYYLANLAAWKTAYACKIHAYCLMTEHVHLIVDPGDNPEHLGMQMKPVAGRQTRYVNRLERRSGILWLGRYKSSPIG